MGLLERLSSWAGGGGTEVTVLVLGLDNSGKTTLLRALRPRPAGSSGAGADTHTTPTVGMERLPEHFHSGGVTFSACDVSGAARHRALWERCYGAAGALLWVVDACDALRLSVARDELALSLAHPALAARRVPLLVFANKCDVPHALTPAQIAAALRLDRVTDKPWHLCAGSALAHAERGGGGAGAAGAGAGAGGALAEGIAWLARQLREQHAHKR